MFLAKPERLRFFYILLELGSLIEILGVVIFVKKLLLSVFKDLRCFGIGGILAARLSDQNPDGYEDNLEGEHGRPLVL